MAIKIGAFLTITNPIERGDMFNECLQMALDCFDVVEVIDGKDTWPKEFNWPIIGEHFQKGYEAVDADWVVHLDCDFFFHQKDFGSLKQALKDYPRSPAVSFYKHQYILPDRYNLKSRLVLAVNKFEYDNRIQFNGGGDLCQPTLNGKLLDVAEVPQAGIPFFNYEKMTKTKEQITEDVERMDRAYHRHFGKWLYSDGGVGAYEGWYRMVKGRFNKPSAMVALSNHPKYVQETIRNLTPEMFGYSGFGLVEGRVYA